jgi:predicted DCC family thiol-disulfide oxidoreductase YuxK
MGDRVGGEQGLTVLYDEHCAFCTAVAEWLERRSRPAIDIAPIGSPLGDRALRDLPPARRYDSVHVLDRCGRRRSGADSLPLLFAAAPGLGWAGIVARSVPGVARAGYAFVANHRGLASRLLGDRLRPASRARAG